MTENTNTAETTETPTAPAKKVAVKKAAPVATAKKVPAKKVAPVETAAAPTKKAVAKKVASVAAPVDTTTSEKKGMTGPQKRILNLLLKGGVLTRAEISQQAPVDNAFCTEYIGSLKDEIRAKNDLIRPSLLTLKFIKVSVHDEEGKNVHRYEITATGKKEMEKINNAEAAK